MSKYKNLHAEIPDQNRLIYWFGPNGKDLLGWYRGNLYFEEYEKSYPGFIPKWWYYAEDVLSASIEDPRFPKQDSPKKERKKRKK